MFLSSGAEVRTLIERAYFADAPLVAGVDAGAALASGSSGLVPETGWSSPAESGAEVDLDFAEASPSEKAAGAGSTGMVRV